MNPYLSQGCYKIVSEGRAEPYAHVSWSAWLNIPEVHSVETGEALRADHSLHSDTSGDALVPAGDMHSGQSHAIFNCDAQ